MFRENRLCVPLSSMCECLYMKHMGTDWWGILLLLSFWICCMSIFIGLKWKKMCNTYMINAELVEKQSIRLNHMVPLAIPKEPWVDIWYNPRKVEQGNSDSSVIVPSIQFCSNNHNSQSDHWIRLKIHPEIPNILLYVGVNLRSIEVQKCLAI